MDDLFHPDVCFLNLASTEDGGIENVLIPVRPAMDERSIGLVDAALLHGDAEEAGQFAGFGDEHNPAGFAVEAVDDGYLSAVGDLV